MKMTCRTLRKKWLWPAFPPVETVKKMLEAQAQAPRAAGHPTESTSQTCPVDLEQWEQELVQALSSKNPQVQGKAAWLNSSGLF